MGESLHVPSFWVVENSISNTYEKTLIKSSICICKAAQFKQIENPHIYKTKNKDSDL